MFWALRHHRAQGRPHPIIFMQCGPVRYRVDAKSQAARRPFSHKVTIRETGFRLAPDRESQSLMQITAIYAALAKDEKRNDRIFDDVLLLADEPTGTTGRPSSRADGASKPAAGR